MKHLFILFFFLVSGLVFGQEEAIRFLDDFRVYEQTHSSHANRVRNTYANIEGSPYLFPDYREADILTCDSITYQGKIRYDLYMDEMEYKVKGTTFWISSKDNILKIILDGKTFIYLNPPGGKNAGYYELLTNGSCQLLCKYVVNYMEAQKAKPYQDSEPARFIRKQNLYYLKKERAAVKLITNKKSVLNYLQDKKDNVSLFIKKNHLSLKKEKDLKKLTEYYNQLKD